ncbi:MAG: sigma-70 family RNA polymerase sigma factor [Ruminococcus sp.]|nr:sigma-70 family RNA polymerase sigma factor [Ruminococcus sp.]
MTGSKSYFEALYQHTKKKVYDHITAKCFALADIDDIFQNTYVEVWKALSKRSDPVPDEEAFVMLIANRQLAKYYSAVRRLRERFAGSFAGSDEDHGDIPDSFSVEDHIVDRAAVEEIRSLLAEKPLLTQKVFFLRYRRDLTIPEVAGLLGIGESAVRMHLYKTLSEIKRRLGKEK